MAETVYKTEDWFEFNRSRSAAITFDIRKNGDVMIEVDRSPEERAVMTMPSDVWKEFIVWAAGTVK